MAQEREQHTPGPWWSVDGSESAHCCFQNSILANETDERYRSEGRPLIVAEVLNGNDADARLIAEAPALMAVAEGVMSWWSEHKYDTYYAGDDGTDECNVYDGEPEFVTAARAAIAKATGTQ